MVRLSADQGARSPREPPSAARVRPRCYAGANALWPKASQAGPRHPRDSPTPARVPVQSIRDCASPLNRSDVCGRRGAWGSAVPSTRSAARPRHLRYKHDAGRAPQSSAPRHRVGLCCRRKRRRDVADRWQAVVERHPTGPLASAGANAAPPMGLMRSRPWCAPLRGGGCACIAPPPARGCSPLARRGRPCRREVTQGERGGSRDARRKAAHAFVDRDHQSTARGGSILGAHAA